MRTAASSSASARGTAVRRDFWRQKWSREHRWAWIVLIAVHGILQIAVLRWGLAWLHAVIALAAVGMAVCLRNRREGYIEHHLYDEMLD